VHTELKPEWVTYQEASRLSSLGRTTLWRLCSAGEIEVARVGRAVRLKRASLEAYIERSATGIAAAKGEYSLVQ
jgi:excisionase family DNA binding protein